MYKTLSFPLQCSWDTIRNFEKLRSWLWTTDVVATGDVDISSCCCLPSLLAFSVDLSSKGVQTPALKRWSRSHQRCQNYKSLKLDWILRQDFVFPFCKQFGNPNHFWKSRIFRTVGKSCISSERRRNITWTWISSSRPISQNDLPLPELTLKLLPIKDTQRNMTPADLNANYSGNPWLEWHVAHAKNKFAKQCQKRKYFA